VKKVKIKIVNAFTNTPLLGNPAGVVLDAENLSEREMQAIASELNLSETAFVLPPTVTNADCRIRWFTPTQEVNLCGHATLATFHALAEESRINMSLFSEYHFKVETVSGILPVVVVKKPDDILIKIGLSLKEITSGGQPRVEMLRILNVTRSEIASTLSDFCDGNVFIRIKRYHTLFNMKPNFVTMAYYLETRNLQGLCIYTTETVDKMVAVHARYFAPTQGINEDPVTGSIYGPLAVILFRLGHLNVINGFCEFIAEQGEVLGKKGRVLVELNVSGNEPTSVYVGGRAVTVMEGEMLIDK